MWRRREEAEIRTIERSAARRRAFARFAYPILWIPAIFFASAFLDWIGIFQAKLGKPPPNIDFTDAMLRNIPISLVLLVIVIFGLRRQRKENQSALLRLICTRCNTISSRPSLPDLCECGGALEPVAFWRWSEDELQHT